MWYSSWITNKGRPTVAGAGTGAALYRRLIPAVWNAAKPKTIRLMKEAIDKTQKQLDAGQTINAPIGRPSRAAISRTIGTPNRNTFEQLWGK